MSIFGATGYNHKRLLPPVKYSIGGRKDRCSGAVIYIYWGIIFCCKYINMIRISHIRDYVMTPDNIHWDYLISYYVCTLRSDSKCIILYRDTNWFSRFYPCSGEPVSGKDTITSRK